MAVQPDVGKEGDSDIDLGSGTMTSTAASSITIANRSSQDNAGKTTLLYRLKVWETSLSGVSDEELC